MHCLAKVLPAVAILVGSVFLPAFNVRVRRRPDAVRDDPPSNFSKTLRYAKNMVTYARKPLFKAACDSSAFTCEEIIQLVSFADADRGFTLWANTAMLFAQGRANKGCISDPDNAKSIVVSFEEQWERQWSLTAVYEVYLHKLTQAFITDVEVLKPAKGVASPPMQLQTGFRTDKAMEKLLTDVENMMPVAFLSQSGSLLENEFKHWVKQITSHGEQFSGPQLVSLVEALPLGFIADNKCKRIFARAVSVLLEHLEQYVAGITCEQVISIQRLSTRFNMILPTNDEWIAGLAALKSNIVDGQNKVAIVADPIVQDFGYVAESMEKVLRDVGVGLPPKYNPIFGVVKGSPVILVVDESDSMDANLTLGHDAFTRREFCHSQIEVVLEGLPNGSYFNIIQYSSSAVKIFPNPVLVSKTSISAAMDKVSSTWRDDYAPGRDPVPWLQKVRGFSLKFRHQFKSSARNSEEALQLAYATVALPSQQTEQLPPRDPGLPILTKDLPQIYFLITGPPDGGAGQILDKMDQFDSGRNIPVNAIVLSNASADPLTKQFGKDLASKTGGFFRSIEQA